MAEEQARTAAEAPPTCDRKDGAGEQCTQQAVWTYLWEWGEGGVCCAEHGQLMQQMQEPLGRRVTLSQLAPAAPAALTRDERTLLIASKLSAEAEADDRKLRGLELYPENVKLTRQVQMQDLREKELRAQLKEHQKDIAELREQAAVRDTDHAEAVAELGRLRTLVKFTPTGDEPQTSASRVDG